MRDYLRNIMHCSSGEIKRAKHIEGGININGKSVYVDAVVHFGDCISLTVQSDDDNSDIVAISGQLDIVYEDDDLLIINKAANMPVHPSQNHHFDSLANIVMGYYKCKNMNFVFRPINRLDRGTSGLMTISKNVHSAQLLTNELKSGNLKREYLAVCLGHPNPPNGTIDAPIGRCDDSVIKREVRCDGADAVTHYKTINHNDEYSLLRLKLESGRTHQIRVHLAYIGHPLLGDFLYGKEEKNIISRAALHSTYLKLIHPTSGKIMEFTSPLPSDMDIIKAP